MRPWRDATEYISIRRQPLKPFMSLSMRPWRDATEYRNPLASLAEMRACFNEAVA